MFSKINSIKNKFKSNQNSYNLVKKSFLAFIVRGGAAGSAFFMNLIIANALDITDAGLFFISFAILTILSTILRLGGDIIFIKYLSIYNEDHMFNNIRYLVDKVLIKSGIISVVVSLLLFLFRDQIEDQIFHKEGLGMVFKWMFLSIPFTCIYYLISFAFQALKVVVLSISIQNLILPVLVSVCIVLLSPQNGGELAFLFFLCSVFVALLAIFLWYFKLPSSDDIVKGLPENFNAISFNNWIYAVLQIAILWGGQFISGFFTSEKDMAHLAVSQRITTLISFILIAINYVSAPHFSSLYDKGKLIELEKYAKTTTKLMVFCALPIIGVVVLFPSSILSLFGDGYEDGYLLLAILSVGQFINVITGSVGFLLLMTGNEKTLRNITIKVGVFAILTNIIFVYLFGILGSAISISASIALQNLWAMNAVKRILGFNTIQFWR